MPELAEVETIRRNLLSGSDNAPSLAGQQISAVRVFWDRSIAAPPVQEFVSCLSGESVQDIDRRGKFLIFKLTGAYLLAHLRMSGDLAMEDADGPLSPHARIVLEFYSGYRLSFVDPRKFGRMWLTDDPGKILGSLGPEPFEERLNAEEFHRMVSKRRRQLKTLLIDQGFLAGIGNIYADEALHVARLHPLRLAHTLSPEESARLLSSLRAVLLEGIERHGASIDWVYRGGDFQNYFGVYRRNGEPCRVCGEIIQRIIVGQRSTHFCPGCQKQALA